MASAPGRIQDGRDPSEYSRQAVTADGNRTLDCQIIARHVEMDDAFRDYVAKRLHFGLMPFEQRIAKATVSFTALGGPPGAADQHCVIALTLIGGREVSAEGRGAGPRLALGRTAERIVRVLRKMNEKERDPPPGAVEGRKYRPAA